LEIYNISDKTTEKLPIKLTKKKLPELFAANLTSNSKILKSLIPEYRLLTGSDTKRNDEAN